VPFVLAYGSLAARQHGLVTRTQLRELGLTERVIDHAVRTGEVIRTYRGVYRVAGAPVTQRQRVMAACFFAGDEAAASHRTAAFLDRLIDAFPRRIDVTVPYERQVTGRGFSIHRSRTPFGRRFVDNVPITDTARTLRDLAAVLPRNELGVVLDRALRRHLVKLDAVADDSHRRGSGTLRELVAERIGKPGREGDLESRFFDLIERLDIPRPVTQHKILVDGIEVARLDIAYVEEKIAIEIDAYSDHSDMRSFVRDRRRNNIVAADHGFMFLHFTRADLDKPRYVRDVIVKTVEQRRA